MAVVAVNNDENGCSVDIKAPGGKYQAMLSGGEVDAGSGNLHWDLGASDGEIFVKIKDKPLKIDAPVKAEPVKKQESKKEEKTEEKNSEVNIKPKNDDTDRVDIKSQKNTGSRVEIKPDEGNKPEDKGVSDTKPEAEEKTPEKIPDKVPDKPYEEMTVPELQAAILQKMANNGPVTDDMKRSVSDNIWRDSLLNWVKSFR